MRRLPRPTPNVGQVLELCAHRLTRTDLLNKLVTIGPALTASEAQYAQLGAIAELYRFQRCDAVGTVTAEEMVWIYDNRFSRARDARRFYEELRAATWKCPFCALREASTLDHYLPKADHPHFAITPLNLVPCCKDCNFAKSSRNASGPETQLLHPYFDDVDGDVWLTATVVQGTPPGVVFQSSPPVHWDRVKAARVKAQFVALGLGALYAANGADEMAGIARHLVVLAERGGQEAVRTHLLDSADSWSRETRNSWQAALYRALAASEWYWMGGHRNTG